MALTKLTLEAFDNLAPLYQERFMDLTIYNDSYDLFCDLLPEESSSLLEIGCGPGNITRYLLSKRPDLKILGIDLAPNMVRLAKENNPGASFEVMDCRDIIKIKEVFDGIVCGFCTPYLSKDECSKLFKDCSALLKAEGIIYLSTIEGKYEDSRLETSSNGQYKAFVYYHEQSFLDKALSDSGFEIVERKRVEYQKSDTETADHLIYLARKKQLL